MLDRLALQFSGTGNLYHQRNMEKDHVPFWPFRGNLPNGFQKGLSLNVSDRSADLRNDHIHIFRSHRVNPGFDFVCNMGDNLHGSAQIVAPAFPVQNGPPDFSGGNGTSAGEIFVHKALIMSKVQICFRAVFRYKDFSVLVGTHSAGVHIEIRVKFLITYLKSSLFQEPPQRRGADTLSQSRNDAACDKDKFCIHF